MLERAFNAQMPNNSGLAHCGGMLVIILKRLRHLRCACINTRVQAWPHRWFRIYPRHGVVKATGSPLPRNCGVAMDIALLPTQPPGVQPAGCLTCRSEAGFSSYSSYSSVTQSDLGQPRCPELPDDQEHKEFLLWSAWSGAGAYPSVSLLSLQLQLRLP